MEMNVITVAWHKLFRGKPSFDDKKKKNENSRFGELSTEEIQEIMDNAVSVTTKKLQSSRLDYVAEGIRSDFSLKVAKLKYDRRDFTHS